MWIKDFYYRYPNAKDHGQFHNHRNLVDSEITSHKSLPILRTFSLALTLRQIYHLFYSVIIVSLVFIHAYL